MLGLIDKFNIKVLDESEKSIKLAMLYIENKIIPEKYLIDAIHISIATVNSMDMIISTNFQYIVKDKTRIFTNLINESLSYYPIKILSPKEIFKNDNI
jgi:hypothetical protein